jgi:hypothetical protein
MFSAKIKGSEGKEKSKSRGCSQVSGGEFKDYTKVGEEKL